MSAKPQDRRESAASSQPGESGVTSTVDTLVAAGDSSRVHITDADLVAPTLHASPGGAPADLLPGTILDAVYRVEKEIGRGAMGTVYLVEHLRLGRKFAAKVVSSRHAENDEIGARLRNEARVASRVQHENIVDVTHLGQTQSGALFIVMELLTGGNLRELLQSSAGAGGPKWLPDADVRALIGDVMAGLGAAHAAGIVHRDLKPDNVFVVDKGGRPRAKIVDFGISRSSESKDLGLTRDGQIIGTPLYMAPEQARGGPTVDARADIYSLGVVCHELLTGVIPFEATSVYDMIVKHATEPPPPLRDARPELPEALEKVLLRALAKKPDQRFQTVDEMRAAWDEAWATSLGATPLSIPAPARSVPPVADDSVDAPPQHTVPAPLEAPAPREGRPMMIGAIVGVLLIAGVAGFFVTQRSTSMETPPPIPPVVLEATPEVEVEPPVVPEPSLVPEPPTPESDAPLPTVVTRRVETEPAGATVIANGSELCTTPCTVEVGETPLAIQLRLRGYRHEAREIDGASSEPVSITLRRAHEAPALAPR